VASMSALIAYPPLIEPLASARVQSWGSSAAYAAFAVLAGLSAWAGVRAAAQAPLADQGGAAGTAGTAGAAGAAGPGGNTDAASKADTQSSAPHPQAETGALEQSNTAARQPAESAPTWARQSLWLLLSALGSVMLLAATTHITQNVASIPFRVRGPQGPGLVHPGDHDAARHGAGGLHGLGTHDGRRHSRH